MRILSRQEIEKLINAAEAISIMEEVFAAITEGKALIPERTVITKDQSDDSVLFMPGYLKSSDGIGAKVVSVFPSNVRKGVPTISAQILLCDPESGAVHAILDGTYITALRTAATTAVATKYLAREDAIRLGVFGAGVQGQRQVEAHCTLRPLKSIVIFDPNAEKAQALVLQSRRWCDASVEIKAAKDPNDVLSQCDIIITATTSPTPVFDGSLLTPGTHINSIGSYKPHVREVDDATIQRSKIAVDSYEHALKEAGDLIQPIERGILKKADILAELGELVLHRKTVRRTPEDITFFKCVGLAVQDIAVAQRVLEKAERENVGMVVPG